MVENQKNLNALLTETAIKNTIEKQKSKQNDQSRLNLSATDTKYKEKHKDSQNFLSLNPKLSADFYKMTRKKNRKVNSLDTSLQIIPNANDEKITNNNKKLNETFLYDNELEFPSRDIFINDLNVEFNKPKKVVNVLTLD
jgi:hypothetical protein